MSLRMLRLALILLPAFASANAAGQLDASPMMKPAMPFSPMKALPSAVMITGFSGTFAVIIRGATLYPVYAGEWVRMNGRGFGAVQGNRQLVVAAPDQDIVLQIQSWSDSQIVFHGPTMEQLGLDPASRVPGAGNVTVAIKDPNGRFEARANQAFSGAICDRDEDGHGNVYIAGCAAPDDCNDHDGNAYPGNQEIWDPADHDEDCVKTTHGIPPAFRTVGDPETPLTQICSGSEVIVRGRNESYTVSNCAVGTVCVPQPTGAGICMAQPPGWTPAPIALVPSGPQR